jgi:hypothetical protein
MSSKSKLIKSLVLYDLEKEGASHDEFQDAITSEALSKEDKKKILFNLDEIGTEKISDRVLKDDVENSKSEE